MKRPERKRQQRHRRTQPPPGVDLAEIAEEVRYIGSPEHKLTPSFAGHPPDQTLPSVTRLWRINETWLSHGFATHCARDIAEDLGKVDFLATFGGEPAKKHMRLGLRTIW